MSVADGAPGQHILSPLLTADSFFSFSVLGIEHVTSSTLLLTYTLSLCLLYFGDWVLLSCQGYRSLSLTQSAE